jgi:peptide/nickel transport system substrate-binding protein
VLLAACGEDEDEATVSSTAAATGTSDQVVATPIEPDVQATVTSSDGEPTATSDESEPSVTADATTGSTDPMNYYGLPIEPVGDVGGTLVRGSSFVLYNGYLILASNGINEMFEPLTDLHPETGEPLPLLAESWEAASDGLTWTFTLRGDVTFQDGEPFLAEDVKFTVELLNAGGWGTDPLTQSTATVIDDRTVEFTFDAPAIETTFALYYYAIRAKHVLADLDPATADNNTISTHPGSTGLDPSKVVGTGPFVFQEIISDDRMVLAAYEGYWRGRPNLDSLIVRTFASLDALPTALLAGEIDLAGFMYSSLNPAQALLFEGADVTVEDFPEVLLLNCVTNLDPEKTTLFQDKLVRQALLYAIDREALVEGILFGYGSVPDSILATPMAINLDDLTVHYDYDADKAAQLLDEAGWVAGPDGVREKNGQKLAFTGWYVSADTVLESTALAVQEYWRAIGVDMTPQGEDQSALFVRVEEQRDFEVVFWDNWSNNTLDQRWLVDGSSDMAYTNPELEALAIQAATELDADRRRALRTEVENLIMEELPIAPLMSRRGIVAIRNGVHNIIPNANDFYFNVATWWVE